MQALTSTAQSYNLCYTLDRLDVVPGMWATVQNILEEEQNNLAIAAILSLGI